MLSRRTLITGLISFAAAPAIVKASSLMPVKRYDTLCIPKPSDFIISNYDKYISESVTQPIRLYWIDDLKNIHVMPIEESNLYLDSLNDHS